MVRKRKIPARKHHGIRDPLKQKEKLERSLKLITNNPPTQDDQKPGGKFTRFQQLIEDTKAGKKFKRQQPGREDLPAGSSAANKQTTDAGKTRNFKQFADETDEDYLRRVNRVTNEAIKEAQYEIKYGVKVIRDAKTGAITVQKRPKNEIDELLKQKAREKQGKKGKKAKQATKPMDPKVAKQLIKQAIKEDEEERRKETSKELQEYKHDYVKFGEVVHAPPTLSTLPRRAQKNETVPRPGRKQNLLLKSLLNGDNAEQQSTKPNKPTKTLPKATNTKAQLKGKRKDLPKATRSMLENERSKMVEMYRQLKMSKEKRK